MQTKIKYCRTLLFPLLLSGSFIAVAEVEQPLEKVNEQQIEQGQQGKLIWADLYTGDVTASLDFYTKTFGWSARKFDEDSARYHILFDGEQAVAGVLARSARRNKTESALWIGSVFTDDIKEKVSKATKNKATIILQPHSFPLFGQRAVIADPQGGVIALLEFDSTNKAHQKISNRWDWAQLFSINTQKAASFYQKSLNYTVEDIEKNQTNYYLSQQNEVRASIVNLPDSFEQRDRWVNFISITDFTNTLTKAVNNGAEIIYQPEGDTFAIIADPNGALLGLTMQDSE